jgi:hypothetical protein
VVARLVHAVIFHLAVRAGPLDGAEGSMTVAFLSETKVNIYLTNASLRSSS